MVFKQYLMNQDTNKAKYRQIKAANFTVDQ